MLNTQRIPDCVTKEDCVTVFFTLVSLCEKNIPCPPILALKPFRINRYGTVPCMALNLPSYSNSKFTCRIALEFEVISKRFIFGIIRTKYGMSFYEKIPLTKMSFS